MIFGITRNKIHYKKGKQLCFPFFAVNFENNIFNFEIRVLIGSHNLEYY